MNKETKFCNSLYLIGLKNLLLDGNNKVELTDKYHIITKLSDDYFKSLIENNTDIPSSLDATIYVKNNTSSRNEYTLRIRKYHETLKCISKTGLITCFKNMNDYQKAKFILDIDSSLKYCRSRYCCKESNGFYSHYFYCLTTMQAEKDYTQLKRLLRTRVRI